MYAIKIEEEFDYSADAQAETSVKSERHLKVVDISDKLVDSVFSPLTASANTYCFNRSRNIGCK